ncbi:hypothetical protein B0H66DRAFT_568948 [Apodospora peruviana]|uniref:Cytochrome c oxidase assembly protein COX20, mitochondrial n=1 Tax=Apodospora peruviana TaxID=516989 RepID=A0AAE0HTV8_9PEZI|nr:hypothetical protein B0H66DRAFT_568948 [Apodospora peruviana]
MTTDGPSREQSPADPTRSWLAQSPSESEFFSSSQQQQQQQQQQQPPQSPSSDLRQQPPQRPRLADAAQTIKPADILKVHQAPCGREGLMTGIGTGFAVLGLRWVIGSPIWKAANWGVGAFVAASAAGWEYCRFQRRKEMTKMKRVVEVYDRKHAERAVAKKTKEEEDKRLQVQREEEEKRKERGWKFW